MPLDPDTLRLAEEMVRFATEARFGHLIVEVTVRFKVDLQAGKATAAGVTEVHPRVTIEQLRKTESVLT